MPTEIKFNKLPYIAIVYIDKHQRVIDLENPDILNAVSRFLIDDCKKIDSITTRISALHERMNTMKHMINTEIDACTDKLNTMLSSRAGSYPAYKSLIDEIEHMTQQIT